MSPDEDASLNMQISRIPGQMVLFSADADTENGQPAEYKLQPLQLVEYNEDQTEKTIDNKNVQEFRASLKAEYVKEYTLRNRYITSGSGAKEEKSDWYYFDSMSFLRNCVSHRKYVHTLLL